MTTTITPEEFEKALARACLRKAASVEFVDVLTKGDAVAVVYGPTVRDIANEAGLSVPQVRRRLYPLQNDGKVLRDDRRGGSTSWWLKGLAELPPRQIIPTPCNWGPSSAPAVHATPSPATAPRQGVMPALVPARQHWSDVLGVARDCSTSEAREAFKSALAAVDDLDLDAEQQRQRIRDAYNARLVEDGISE